VNQSRIPSSVVEFTQIKALWRLLQTANHSNSAHLPSFIHYGDLYSAPSRLYYSEALPTLACLAPYTHNVNDGNKTKADSDGQCVGRISNRSNEFVVGFAVQFLIVESFRMIDGWMMTTALVARADWNHHHRHHNHCHHHQHHRLSCILQQEVHGTLPTTFAHLQYLYVGKCNDEVRRGKERQQIKTKLVRLVWHHSTALCGSG